MKLFEKFFLLFMVTVMCFGFNSVMAQKKNTIMEESKSNVSQELPAKITDQNQKNTVETIEIGRVDKGLTLKQWGMISMGIGCASIGAGFALNMYAIKKASNANKMDPSIPGELEHARDKYNAAQSTAHIAYGMYSAGITLLGLGLVLMVLDSEADYIAGTDLKPANYLSNMVIAPLQEGLSIQSTWKF